MQRDPKMQDLYSPAVSSPPKGLCYLRNLRGRVEAPCLPDPVELVIGRAKSSWSRSSGCPTVLDTTRTAAQFKLSLIIDLSHFKY